MIGLSQSTWDITMPELNEVWQQSRAAFRSVLPEDSEGDIE